MTERHQERDILRELEPVVESELNRHLRIAEEWHPHDFVPWSEGHNFSYLGGEDWEPTQSKLGKVAQTAMYVNLLTEDNLPSYHREIATLFGRDSSWGEWVGQWTAEEHKHGTAMYNYLMVTRGIDPVKYERARMAHMKAGYDSGEKSPLDAIAYVTMQELATRIAHRNTGLEAKTDGDILADRLLNRVAKDENLHMLFYRNLGTAALQIAPSEMIQSIAKEVTGFQMPGSATIPEFWPSAKIISDAEIYDFDIHANKIVKPTLEYWKIDEIKDQDLSDEAKVARDGMRDFIGLLDTEVKKLRTKREAKKATVEH